MNTRATHGDDGHAKSTYDYQYQKRKKMSFGVHLYVCVSVCEALAFRIQGEWKKKQIKKQLVASDRADQCIYLSVRMFTVGGIIKRLPNRKQFNLDFMVIDLKKHTYTHTHIYQRAQEIDQNQYKRRWRWRG